MEGRRDWNGAMSLLLLSLACYLLLSHRFDCQVCFYLHKLDLRFHVIYLTHRPLHIKIGGALGWKRQKHGGSVHFVKGLS